MWYAVNMKKKSYDTITKINRKHDVNSPGPVVVFFITLGVVLLCGVSIMFLWNHFGDNAKVTTDAAGVEQSSQSASGEVASEINASGQDPEQAKEQAKEQEAGQAEGLLWEKQPEEQKEPTATPEEAVVEESRYGEVLQDAQYLKENRIVPWSASDEESVTLGFVGDILLDDEYAILANLLQRGGTIRDGISEEMLQELLGVDILVANNEFPYTNRGMPTEGKTYTFRADPDAVSYLQDMGVDVAVLANNHMFDFGEEGLLDTLSTLEEADIPYVGAGRNLEEASAPVYFIANDIKIAFVAATQIERLENPDTRGATEQCSGVFRCLDPTKLYEIVREADANSDFVVVYMHWGTENVAEPDWAQLDQAPGLAEAGADLIIGDHPHCLQGIEYYGSVPVIYSLGNFWFNSKTVDTGMVQVEIGKEGLESFRFVPAIQSDCRVKLAKGAEKERILSYMRELSPKVTIDEEGYVSIK